nr:MAG TPA: hypothetical protein [Caudoviricetes sp.]
MTAWILRVPGGFLFPRLHCKGFKVFPRRQFWCIMVKTHPNQRRNQA